MVTVWFGWWVRTAAARSSMPSTLVPSNWVTTSPSRRPDLAAGELGLTDTIRAPAWLPVASFPLMPR